MDHDDVNKQSRYQRWSRRNQRKVVDDVQQAVSDESEVEVDSDNQEEGSLIASPLHESASASDSEQSEQAAVNAGSDDRLDDSQRPNEGNPIEENDGENHHINEGGEPAENEEMNASEEEESEEDDEMSAEENEMNAVEEEESEEDAEMDGMEEQESAEDEEMNEVEEGDEENPNEDNASLVGSAHSVEEDAQELDLGIGPESASEHSASDSEQEDEEPGPENQEDELLYEGARVTFRQSLLTILSLAFKHKLTGACIADLLSVIELHCAGDNIALKTLYKFKKYFSMVGKQNVTCHYYCSVCEVALASEDSVCELCNGRHPTGFFVSFPFLSQLQSMYLRPGFKEGLQFKTNRVKKNINNIEDIYDAAVYQEQVLNGFLANPDNISFFLYFDGISIFDNSKFSIWPLFLSINELRYKDRVKKENIVLAGLWFGNKKPNPNLFLSPLVQEMHNFENEGADFRLPNNESVRVRGKIIGAVADLPAKALFMRIVQYNGIHSCSNCMSSGARYDLGNSTIQVYPYSRQFDLRSNDDMINFANMAVVARQQDPDATIYGVKGPTLLYALLPNMINCIGSDIMHGTFLGIMKTKLDLWFGSEHSGNPYNISASVNLVDARLQKIKLPQFCTKMPRSIKKERALFKAADYKLFTLIYALPVLKGILPAVYWEHHCKLVSAISLLSQQSFSHEQIDVAEELLHTYVKDFQQLYGIRYVGLNVHQLLHLALIVRNLGPLWVYACFFYEGLNGILTRLVHGTRHAALQISASCSVFLNLPAFINEMEDCEAKVLCLKFLQPGNNLKITEQIDNVTGVVGKYRQFNPPLRILRLLAEKLNIVGGKFKYFFRLKRKGVVYCSETYLRSKTRLSCFVEVFHEGVPYLCRVNSFIKWSSCGDGCPAVCNDCRKCFLCIVTSYDRVLWEIHENGHDIFHLSKVAPTNYNCVFTVDCIRKQCFYLPIDHNEYIAVPVNNLEVE